MLKFFKIVIKGLSIFAILDLLYFVVAKIVFEQSGDTDTLLMAEGFAFVSLFYAYLGVRFIQRRKKTKLSLIGILLLGIVFSVVGFLITIGPVHIVSGLCDLIGVILFDITNESNVQIVFLWIICSVVTALICYGIAEKIYEDVDRHE